MLPYLNSTTPFPPVENALDDPNGLLAAGADLSANRLIQAYSNGIFPWYSPGEPILWWSPDPRTVFNLKHFKVHKSVKQTLRKLPFKVSLNVAFQQVIQQCSLPRSEQNGTWITSEMQAAYVNLHQQKRAHSVEVWLDEELVGGIYGVQIGGVFCGESMFSRVSNGSKIALSCLAKYLTLKGFSLIDCQVDNPHLTKLGAQQISRDDYLFHLHTHYQLQLTEDTWDKQTLNYRKLIGVVTDV